MQTHNTEPQVPSFVSLLTPKKSLPDDTGWKARHNQVVFGFVTDTYYTPTRDEDRILSLLQTIHKYVRNRDWLMVEHVITPMMEAAGDALNWNLGELDGGTLSSALCKMQEICEGGDE